MRNPRVGRWKDIPNTLGLLLFAQRIEEALFNFSLDSYKAPALNTHTRCLELIATSKEVLSHRITPKALLPIIEELASSIRNDRAARGCLGIIPNLSATLAGGALGIRSSSGPRPS